jgi:elongin-A
LPIKLEPDDSDPFSSPTQENHYRSKHTSSSSSSSGFESNQVKIKTEPTQHTHHSSRNGHSGRDEKKSKSSSNKSHHHHHGSSHGESSSSSKRKHGETETESKDNRVSSHKKPKLEPEEIKNEKHSPSKSSSRHHHHHHHDKTSSSKHKETASSSSVKPKEKPPKRKREIAAPVEEEMDGSQGIGFAEALALFDMPSSSKKKDLQLADKIVTVKSKSPSKSSKDFKTPSSSSSSTNNEKSSSKDSKKSLQALTAPPKLLTQKLKLEPLPDIVSDLPVDVSIPDYRPMPLSSAVKDYINTSVLGSSALPMNSRPLPKYTDAELLVQSFSSKANRTRVFSGNRVQRSVPSLFEMCIRVLKENIDFLSETGGVPFDILKPVLEHAKPDQLTNIEYYNPYIMEESDVLWEPHCKRKFRTRKREEMESWREMYERCEREDVAKLNRLTKNIKHNQETTSNGVQKTKMAFVDSMVKPPRNIMRKQEIFGTNRKLIVSPAARTEGLKNIMPNMAMAGDARLRVSAGLRDDAQNGK